MQLIRAVIQPYTLQPVKDALTAFGISGITITEVLSDRPLQAHTETYRGIQHHVDLLPRLQLDLIAADTDVPDLTRVITRAATPNPQTDIIVWVTPIIYLIRIRTGERGVDAI